MKVICFVNNKGGVGKTALATNCAYELSTDHKVLLIDLDEQCNVSTVFGLDEGTYSTIDIFESPEKLAEAATHVTDNLHVIQADKSMNLNIHLLEKLPSPYNRLELALEGTDYDYVLLDCPPSLNYFVGNAIVASDEVVIVSHADLLSVQGVFKTITEVNSIKPDASIKLVMNQIKDSRLSGDMTAVVRSFSKENGYQLIGTVPTSLTISNAVAYQSAPLLMTKYRKDNNAVKALQEITEAIR